MNSFHLLANSSARRSLRYGMFSGSLKIDIRGLAVVVVLLEEWNLDTGF